MLRIKVNNEFLDVDPGYTSELVFRNRLVYPDSSGVYSEIPFTVPDTHHNRRLLNFWHDPATVPDNRISAEIYENNNFQASGYIIINSYDPFEIVFYGDDIFFRADANEINIRDIDFKEKVMDGLFDPTKLSINTYPDANYLFAPVRLPEFEEGSENAYSLWMNYYDILNQRYDYEHHENKAAGGAQPFCGFFYLPAAIQIIADHIGYTIIENYIEDTELKNRVILNLSSIIEYDTVIPEDTYIHFKFDMPSMTVDEFFQSLASKYGLLILSNENDRTLRITTKDSVLNTRPAHDYSEAVQGKLQKKKKPYRGVKFGNADDIYVSGSPDYFNDQAQIKYVPTQFFSGNITTAPIIKTGRTQYNIDNDNALRIAHYAGLQPGGSDLYSEFFDRYYYRGIRSGDPSDNSQNAVSNYGFDLDIEKVQYQEYKITRPTSDTNFTIKWGDGTTDTFSDDSSILTRFHTYGRDAKYTLEITKEQSDGTTIETINYYITVTTDYTMTFQEGETRSMLFGYNTWYYNKSNGNSYEWDGSSWIEHIGYSDIPDRFRYPALTTDGKIRMGDGNEIQVALSDMFSGSNGTVTQLFPDYAWWLENRYQKHSCRIYSDRKPEIYEKIVIEGTQYIIAEIKQEFSGFYDLELVRV